MCDKMIVKKAETSVNDEDVAFRPTPPFSAGVDSAEGGTECTTWRSSVAERAEW
jgi:hypothetical protein